MILRTRVNERGERFACFGAQPLDEQQLALAARRPVLLGRRENAIELCAGERRKRPDFVPLPEAITCGEAPADRAEIAACKREGTQGSLAKNAQLGREGGRGRGKVDAQLGGEAFGARAIAAAESVAELHCLREAADVIRPRAQQLVAARQFHVARLAGRAQLLGRLKPAATFDPVDLVEDQRGRLANRWTGL